MEAIKFAWLVAAIAEDFAFDWTSLLYESYWCQPDPPGNFSYSLNAAIRKPGGFWWPITFPVEDYEHSPPSWGTHTGNTGAVSAVVTTAIHFEQFGSYPLPDTFKVEIWNPITNLPMFDATGQGPNLDGERQLVLSGTLPPFTSFQIRIWHDAAQVLVNTSVVIGVEAKA